MTNNSSERVFLPPNIPPLLNTPTNIRTYVEQEQSGDEFDPLAIDGPFENGRDRGLNYVDV